MPFFFWKAAYYFLQVVCYYNKSIKHTWMFVSANSCMNMPKLRPKPLFQLLQTISLLLVTILRIHIHLNAQLYNLTSVDCNKLVDIYWLVLSQYRWNKSQYNPHVKIVTCRSSSFLKGTNGNISRTDTSDSDNWYKLTKTLQLQRFCD